MDESSLIVDGSIWARALHGPLVAEYALVDAQEILLASTEPGRTHEVGYETTTTLARGRLEHLGLCVSLAFEAFYLLREGPLARFALGPAARRALHELGPAEGLRTDGFDHSLARYRGALIDFAAIGEALGAPELAHSLQLLGVMARFEELSTDARVSLGTETRARQLRAGQRTFARPRLFDSANLAPALRRASAADRGRAPATLSISEVLALLTERGQTVSDASQGDRYAAALRAVNRREAPERGHLAAADHWAMEQALDTAPTTITPSALDALEERAGKSPATAYLRLRLALENAPVADVLAIAQRVEALAMSVTGFPEAQLLASRAWHKAGNARRALPFARDVLENKAADEVLRERAHQALELASAALGQGEIRRSTSQLLALAAPVIEDAPITPVRRPSAAALRAASRTDIVTILRADPRRDEDEPAAITSVAPVSARTPVSLSLAPAHTPTERPPAPTGELAECASDPFPGAPLGAPSQPTTPPEARIYATALVRVLGERARLERSTALEIDAEGMVWALEDALARVSADPRAFARESDSVAALVSELLARTVGAAWISLGTGSADKTEWVMHVPPGVEFAPFEAVARFLSAPEREPNPSFVVRSLVASARAAR